MVMKRESASNQFKIDRRDLKQTTLSCPLQNTWKSPEFAGLRKETMTANFLTFHLELSPV